MTEGGMRSLEQVVALIERWRPQQAKDREIVLSRLDGLSTSCGEAIDIWQRYLDAPGAAGDRWTILSWVGPERAKQLHEINLKAVESLQQVCAIAGPEAARFGAYEDNLIEMAYRQFKPGETGLDVARAAIERMRSQREYLNAVAARIRSIRFVGPQAAPKRAARSGPTVKKLPAKKTKQPKNVKKTKKAKGAAGGSKKIKKKNARVTKKSTRKPAARRK